MYKSSYLTRIAIASFFRYLKYEIAKELVIAICSLLMFFLFFYIFNDFLNQEIKNISQNMRDQFAFYLSLIVLALAAALGGRQIFTSLNDAKALAPFATRLGEDLRGRRLFFMQVIPMTLAFYFAAGWVITRKVFAPNFTQDGILGVSVGMIIVSCLTYVIYVARLKTENRTKLILKARPNADHPHSRIMTAKSRPVPINRAIMDWRLRSFFARNFFAKLALGFGVGTAFLCSMLNGQTAPLLLYYLLAYISGIFAGWAVISQFVFDCIYAQFEKSLGVSHEQYLWSMQAVASLAGAAIAVTALLATWGSFQLSHAQNSFGLAEGLRVFSVAFVPAWLVPYLAFQIDPRKITVQLLTLILISLFVNTAIIASLFGLFLLPFIAYYGLASQKGRFYRA